MALGLHLEAYYYKQNEMPILLSQYNELHLNVLT